MEKQVDSRRNTELPLTICRSNPCISAVRHVHITSLNAQPLRQWPFLLSLCSIYRGLTLLLGSLLPQQTPPFLPIVFVLRELASPWSQTAPNLAVNQTIWVL